MTYLIRTTGSGILRMPHHQIAAGNKDIQGCVEPVIVERNLLQTKIGIEGPVLYQIHKLASDDKPARPIASIIAVRQRNEERSQHTISIKVSPHIRAPSYIGGCCILEGSIRRDIQTSTQEPYSGQLFRFGFVLK